MLHAQGGHVRRGRAQVVHERACKEIAVLVVDDSLEQRGADAVGEAAPDLTLHDEWVQQSAGVVNADVVQHVHGARLVLDLDDGDIHQESVRGRGGNPVVVVRRREVGRSVVRGLVQAGLEAFGQRIGVPVGDARQPAQRDRVFAVPRLCVA